MTDTKANSAWTTEMVIAIIRELAEKTDLPGHLIEGEIKGTDTVDTLGIDSIGGVYVVERLEEETGLLMPDDFLELTFTLDEIAIRLNRLLEQDRG